MGKILYKLIITIILLVFVSACSENSQYEIIFNGEVREHSETKSVQATDLEPYTIGIVPKVSDIPYFNAVKEGALEAGKELGVNVLYMGPTIASWKQQESIIQELINKQVDVIAVSANDPEKLGPILKKAENQGIKVMTWDSDTNPKYRELFVNMVDPEVLGRHMMDTLAWRLEEEGKFVIMTGSPEAANLNEWIKWIKVQQEEYYPKMDLINIVATDEDNQKAYRSAVKLLKNEPDLRGIIAISTVNPPAATQAVIDEGKVDSVIVVGSSTPNLMREYIKEGTADIVTLWSPQKLGYLTVSLAKNLLENMMPYDGQRIQNIGNIGVKENTVIMGNPIDFTKDNIDQYDF